MLRILNATDESGAVEIYAIDDAGTRSGPATFTLNASSAAEFTAMDLASGNATLGLTGGIGTEVGDARLQIETDLQIVPLAFVQAADGTLSAMHDTVRGGPTDESVGYTYNVPVFNPSTEMTQVSRLRLINPGDAAAAVTIGGRDDSGAEATGGDVTLTLAAGGAKTLTAQQLEAGDTDLTGQLGAGTGKWRLTVSSDQPLEVVNIVASTAGYRNNLSTTAVAGAAPADEAGLNERFVGNSVIYETSGARSTLEAAAGNRFTDTVEADGVTETYMGSYSYRAIGPDAGRLTLDYDDGDACHANLYFSSRTSGWFASHCTGSDYPAEGSWLGGTWVVEADDDDGDGDVTETTYEVNDSLPGVPTSGFFVPAVTSGGSVTASASGTTVALNDGGYIELNDGTRYTCASADGCTVTNGTVTAGTVTGRAPGAGEVDRFPSFRTAAAPGNQTYTVGTAIATLTLPEATGGNGALTYGLAPSVPGLTFNATTRQLIGTPSAAGTHAMTYTVTDEDGDTDTLGFGIDVEETDDGADAAESFGLDVDGGNSNAVGIVFANERIYVVDSISDKVFAYSESGQREATSDFDLDDANVLPDGIAFVNERFYVVDWFRQKVYGYTASAQRDAAADFDLDDDSGSADGIAFANGRFYIVDRSDNKVYAYSASGQRDAAADFDLLDDFAFAVGMDFADGRFYVVNSFRDKVYAYTESGQYDSAGDFDLHEDNNRPDGIGYGNDRFYVVDTASDRVYAYAGAPEPEDTSPGFAADAGPGDKTYTVGTAIDTLTLPEASGGDGTLTYSLSPEVPGLSFDAAAREFTGTPTAAGTHAMTYTATDEDGDAGTVNFSIAVEASDDGGESTGTSYSVDDSLPGVPTSGAFAPSITGGGGLVLTGSGTTITLNDGAYFELDDGTRYTCTSPDECAIVNGIVTQGTIDGRASGGTMEPEDTSPSFATDAGPDNQTYTVGTPIETLTLPVASGGDGTLTYNLSPDVPGLMFNASTRQLTGMPSAARTYTMTYTVTDADGDTDSLSFTIAVEESGDNSGSADGPVAIPDPNLRAAIEAALGKASGEPITEAEMATLTELHVPGADISDLSGLEFAVDLTVLDTQYNYDIVDISPLSGLTNLETFYLGCNRFTDLAPLSGLTNLTDLNIGGNGFTDISSLSGLTKLTRLHVGNNDLTDVSALSGLTNLTELGLGGNEITDLTPLAGLTNLGYLVLLTNNITDVSPLSGLTKLDYLDLRHNAITDISPLSGLTNLDSLYLRNNDIEVIPPLSVSSLLGLADNEIKDISGLSGVSDLHNLDLGGNDITDLSPLSGMTHLYVLRLGFNNIMDLSPLASLTSVSLLDLKFNRIADISALSVLTGGTVLDLRGNPLSDTSIGDHIPAFRSGGVRVLFNSLRTGDLRKGDFDIELVFLDDVTDHQKEVIEHAARRWMSVVVGDLPDYEFAEGYSSTCGGRPYEIPAGERIDDLRIYVSSSVGSTFAIGEGAPHVLRESSRLPAVGCMSVRLDAPSFIFDIALHEVGHILGFGSLWDEFGFIHDLSYSDPHADTHFNGPKAIAAFDEAGGLDYEGKKVPVQKRDGAHWRINGVSGDIMLPGRIGEAALTAITVQSLADMGYVVDVTEADQHSLNDAPFSVGSAVPFHPLDQQGSIIGTTD